MEDKFLKCCMSIFSHPLFNCVNLIRFRLACTGYCCGIFPNSDHILLPAEGGYGELY
jgi:hypothetical protein